MNIKSLYRKAMSVLKNFGNLEVEYYQEQQPIDIWEDSRLEKEIRSTVTSKEKQLIDPSRFVRGMAVKRISKEFPEYVVYGLVTRNDWVGEVTDFISTPPPYSENICSESEKTELGYVFKDLRTIGHFKDAMFPEFTWYQISHNVLSVVPADVFNRVIQTTSIYASAFTEHQRETLTQLVYQK